MPPPVIDSIAQEMGERLFMAVRGDARKRLALYEQYPSIFEEMVVATQVPLRVPQILRVARAEAPLPPSCRSA